MTSKVAPELMRRFPSTVRDAPGESETMEFNIVKSDAMIREVEGKIVIGTEADALDCM